MGGVGWGGAQVRIRGGGAGEVLKLGWAGWGGVVGVKGKTVRCQGWRGMTRVACEDREWPKMTKVAFSEKE